MRLAKHLAHAGVASRRAAEAMIAGRRVTVDGATVTDPARDVTGAEAITVDGAAVGGPARARAVRVGWRRRGRRAATRRLRLPQAGRRPLARARRARPSDGRRARAGR